MRKKPIRDAVLMVGPRGGGVPLAALTRIAVRPNALLRSSAVLAQLKRQRIGWLPTLFLDADCGDGIEVLGRALDFGPGEFAPFKANAAEAAHDVRLVFLDVDGTYVQLRFPTARLTFSQLRRRKDMKYADLTLASPLRGPHDMLIERLALNAVNA
jgi:hypothetical protein